MTFDAGAIARAFQFEGQFLEAQPYGNGHINDTYRVLMRDQDIDRRYILQRINHDIFKQPIAVMENIQRITDHLRQKVGAMGLDTGRHALKLIPTTSGDLYYQDEAGNVWRAYHFIEQATSFDVVESPEQAFEVGKAFGFFQQQLVDLTGPRLHETIPDFHNTPKRFQTLRAAIEADAFNRAKTAQADIEFALQQEAMVHVLMDLQQQDLIPERVTHNDTKINNVMLDDQTGQGLCVVDLDTVMPGLALYDFGDMVRSATCFAAEDEQDLSKVKMEMPIFEALTDGYLATAGEFLNETEKAHLAFSGKLITFEIGIRFLTDYLTGDTYFKIHREGHNLDRARSQFALVRSIAEQEKAMEALIRRF